MAKNIIEVIDNKFSNEVINYKGIVVADFYASWCGPCQALTPIIEGLAKKYPAIKFAKINVEKSPQTATQYNVMSVPNVILFRNGKMADQLANGINPEELEAKIRELSK